MNVAVIGLGYWGPNLIRNIASLPGAALHTICDGRPEQLQRLGAQYPFAKCQTSFERVIDDPEVEAVVIATPVQSHFDLATSALKAGKHVFVEKPLAKTSEQCLELIALAEQRNRVLMVGHLFLYNPAVRKVKDYIDSGELGEIYYAYSQRLNLGIFRKDVNALWNFAPHDLSILSYWFGGPPSRVLARGYSYIQPGIEDVVFATLDYPGGVGASVHISWLDPDKVRRMTVVGSKKMVIYDDVSADKRIMVFDKGVIKEPVANGTLGHYADFGEFQLLLRAGDILIPKLQFTEPLKLECQHFVDCIRSGSRPLTDGYDGLQVVQTLEAIQRSMERGVSEDIPRLG